MKSELVLAYVTFPDEATAHRICNLLVEEGTVACANIFPAHKSIYRWMGQTMRETEIAAVLKTVARRKEALKERIQATHPYQVPCLIFLPIEDGLTDFLRWVYCQCV